MTASVQSYGSAGCGFGSEEELKSESRYFVQSFSNLNELNLTYRSTGLSSDGKKQRVAQIRKRSFELQSLNAKKHHDKIEKLVLKVLEQFRGHEFLKPLVNEGLLQADISEKNCDISIACTTAEAFAVSFNKELLNELYLKMGPSQFEFVLRGIVGHEIGHYVADLIISVDTKNSKIADYKADWLKYHLLVDAIGMQLTGYSTLDFSNALSIYENLGDIPDRLKCLRVLTSN